MPDLDGVEATKLLLGAQPDLAVLVVTMHEDDEHVFAALRPGARGYLVKGAGGEEIVRAVLAVAAGGRRLRRRGGTTDRRVLRRMPGPESPTARSISYPHPTRT